MGCLLYNIRVQVFLQREYVPWAPRRGGYWRPTQGARNDDLLDALSQHESPDVKRMLEYPVEDADASSWKVAISEGDLSRQRRLSRPGQKGLSPWAC